MTKTSQSISPLTWVIISAVGFVLFLASALGLIFMSDRIGTIKPQIYFFLLVIIGLVCAAFLSGALKSHAKYTGQVYGGTLELGGPVLVLVALVFMGYKFMPKKESFNLRFMVYSDSARADVVNNGMLKIMLSKPDSQRIENGFADFSGLDSRYQGKEFNIIARAEGYYALGTSIKIPEDDNPIELFMQHKPDSVKVKGMVISKNGDPVAGAVVLLDNDREKLVTDEYGNFTTSLPLKEGAEINVRVYKDNKLRFNSGQTLSGSGSLTLQLQ